jgi:integrase
MTQELELMPLLDRFIQECEKGKYLQRNGTKLREGTIQNYRSLKVVLENFSVKHATTLTICNLLRCTQREYIREKNRWKKLYRKLTIYFYNDCSYHDNYVGNIMKLLRSLFNYLRREKGIETRDIRHLFHVCKEEIPIIVLNKEQLTFLIHDAEFEQGLKVRLKRTKDIFVLGCTTGLRVSDLFSLTRKNLEKTDDGWYIKIYSKKTGTFTRIMLPDYARIIIKKYWNKQSTLLPSLTLFTFNKYLKEIAEKAGWTFPVEKKRSKRGVIKTLKTFTTQSSHRFCDLVTSHTMRRTAITTYLTLGMPEQLVRKISGHAPGSKEFFKYVKYSDAILDQELNKVHQKFAAIS